MMKIIRKKIIFVLLIIIILLLIPMVVFGIVSTIKYDSNGRVIVKTGEKVPDEVPEGTPISIAVPIDGTKMSEEELLNEKYKIAESLKGQPPVESNNNYDFFAEERKIEEEYKNILIKYYGKERIENLIKENEEYTDNADFTNYILPDSAIEMINISIDLVESKNTSDEEKENVKKGLNLIDLSSLKDEKLITKLKKISVEL